MQLFHTKTKANRNVYKTHLRLLKMWTFHSLQKQHNQLAFITDCPMKLIQYLRKFLLITDLSIMM